MKVKFESKGGFDNVLKWFHKASNVQQNMIESIANQGENRLKEATPEDTGKTASGWVYDIFNNPNSVEIVWRNIAHPESKVNIAKLIELGHGTGTGGYIQPIPYIKQAMDPVWKLVDNDVRELMK